MDQTWPSDRPVPHGAIPIRPRPGGGNNGPALQGSRGNNLNGDDLHLGHRGSGGRRNRTRSYNHSESEEELRPYGSSPYGSSPMMSMHQADLGWYHRSLYDQAEAQYQRRLAAGDLSFSPGKSPRGSSRGSVTFQRSKQPGDHHQETPAVTVAKSPGTQRRQPFRGRTRTSSETSGGKGSRGPYRRKRGHSETEFRPSKPRWDKYDS